MNKLLLRSFKHLLTIFFSALASLVLGQTLASSSVDVNNDYLKEADVIIHQDILNQSIEGLERVTTYNYRRLTVLNPRASRYGYDVIRYDKLTELKSFSATVFDGSGKEIKKLKKNDLLDQSNISGFSLFEDDRIKIADLRQKKYPYTVEFEYTTVSTQTFQLVSWILQSGENVYVRNSEFSISAPDELLPKYYLANSPEPIMTKAGPITSLKWVFNEIPPFKFEPYNYNLIDYTAAVQISPTKFSYAGQEGSLESWASFGSWISGLNLGRDDLSESTKQEIEKMTSELGTKEEKIKAIYNYLQHKTRYVSIQLGIGGYQPFKASVVDEMGYGDCKALSNYTKSLLDAADIDSYYVLVRAGDGERDTDKDTPLNRFNHAILAVPNQPDTIWLECTSQTNPFGYLGTFTGNRNVLLIDGENSKIVRTPEYSAEQNVKTTKASINIKMDGTASGILKYAFSGVQSENDDLNFIIRESRADQEKWLYEYMELPSFMLNDFKFEYLASKTPVANIEMDINFKQLITTSGNRLFLTPGSLVESIGVPKIKADRKTTFKIEYATLDIDSLDFNTPSGYSLEYLPQEVDIKSQFGEFKSSIRFENNTCTLVRKLKLNTGTYPPNQFADYVEFLKAIRKSDLSKLVLINKT